MHHELIVAGFGGQGVILTGQLLAHAAMAEGKEVVWVPSYGPEMRGGIAHCTVIFSDRRIGSPVVSEADSLIAMDSTSIPRFQGMLREGGLLLYNQSLAKEGPERTDLQVMGIPANRLAEELGQSRVANMVMLGAFLAACPVVSFDSLTEALSQVLPKRHHRLIPLNLRALERGAKELEAVASRAD